jgi:hypothetical protein
MAQRGCKGEQIPRPELPHRNRALWSHRYASHSDSFADAALPVHAIAGVSLSGQLTPALDEKRQRGERAGKA